MEYTIIEHPKLSTVNEIRNRLREYNKEYWEVLAKTQYALMANEGGVLAGGLVCSIFGEWLEVEFLWVDQRVRGRGLGHELLERAEVLAIDRGCKTASVNTMSFQARPFYEKHGYVVKYTQRNYPITSSRCYLEKSLERT